MKKLRTLAIIFNLFIIIGAGHGGAPLGLFEFICLKDFLIGDYQFNISGQYEERLATVGLISFVGQSILICSYFFLEKVKSTLSILGCLILLTATYILTKDSWDLNTDIFGFIFSLPLTLTALPFTVTAIVLLVKEIKELRTV
jgi:hypothetical protein